MEKFYRVNFKAKLSKFTLAFKAQSEIDVFWKRGEKIAQSSKVPFVNAQSNFNEQLSISCNMTFDPQQKQFLEKITKFQIILYAQKGNKKVGEAKFDVAPYLNQRHKKPKDYQISLEKCPDKNAKLSFSLTAFIEGEISSDDKSTSSYNTVSVQNIVGNGSAMSTISKSSLQNPNVPTTDKPKDERRQKKKTTMVSIEEAVNRNIQQQVLGPDKVADRIQNLQIENKKIRQQLKKKQKLIKQNQQLKRKIKNQQYDSVKEIKDKIQNGRRQLQKLQSAIKKQVLLQKQVKGIEDEIFKCKFQIMNAFNYANEKGGGHLLYEMQQACGLKEV